MRGLLFYLWGCLYAEAATAELVAIRYVEAAETPYQRTNLTLESAQTKLDCDERGATIECQFEARYVIQNYTDETETIVLSLFTPGHLRDFTLHEGAESLLRELTETEREAFRRLKRASSFASLFDQRRAIQSDEGASLRLAPGQRKEIVYQGKLSPQNIIWTDYPQKTPAINARHLALSTEWSADLYFRLSFGDLSCWPVLGAVSLQLKVPTRWRLGYNPEMSEVETQTKQETQTFFFGTKSPPTEDITLSFYAKAPALQGGGLLVGVGGAFGPEGAFLFRLGYEAGNRRGLLTSLSAETDFRRRVALVPQLGVGTPWVNAFPSLDLFLGVPLLIEQGQSLSVGLRTQLDITYGAIGLSVPFDVYPTRPKEDRLQTAILAHFSF